MEQKTLSPKMLRQRKFLLMLPLLVLPFMTLMFWSLGGGKVENASAQPLTHKGFNMNLPGAYLKDERPLDKMSYYDKAASDSAKLVELMKNDPNYRKHTSMNHETDEMQYEDTSQSKYNNESGSLITSPYGNGLSRDSNEVKVYRKLAELDEAMNKVTAPTMDPIDDASHNRSENTQVNTSDIDRLEQMMQSMKQPEGQDSELHQLNGMLEKILDIQHPDRVQEKIRQTSHASKGQVFAVSAIAKETPVSLLDNTPDSRVGINSTSINQSQQNGFYSLDEPVLADEAQNAIQAVIHETQTLVAGSTVKLRLVNDVYINGMLIPKDNFLFGEAQLSGERLDIKISSLRYQTSLFPVELSVYDMDGMNGIYIPGAITRDVAKQSADRAIQGIGLTTLDPSLGAQAASAGIEAARDLISKKVKLIKVTVKAGYQVLLRDEKQKQNN
ncbi:MAG: conjugative transposon protein TraM [Prolixibacteraceae bacterium]|jgi:conjugative transposon TraM protein|nr:conjugative transposon protein TraM [Prolixibacteraceae bacterium]